MSDQSVSFQPSRWLNHNARHLGARHFGFYLGLLLVAAGIFVSTQWIGARWFGNSGLVGMTNEPAMEILEKASREVSHQAGFDASQSISPVHTSTMFHLLLTLSLVILVGNVLGRLFVRMGQPPVIGEVLAGIALGPSLLGLFYPSAQAWLIPNSESGHGGTVIAALQAISNLGVVLYMFLVGLELDGHKLKHRMGATVAISHSSIVMPFILGVVASLWIYPKVAPENISFLAFSLFCGVAMSITAFPVLARIITDRKLQNTHLGTIAIGCAAADDVTAWCLLAIVIGVVQANVWGAIQVIAMTVAYILFMFLAVKPALHRWIAVRAADGPALTTVSSTTIGVMVSGLLLSACVTEAIGVHALFGAFLLGAIIPSDSPAAKEFVDRFKAPIQFVLLPAFFAFTGLQTEIGLVSTPEHWCMCLIIIVVATLGKFGGTLLAARFSGEGWRESAALGTLMNTRGLMELIVLNIGLELGVISPLFFTMMVIMAVVTTMVTSPFLQWLTPRTGWASQARLSNENVIQS